MLKKLKILLDSEIDPAFAARARIIFDQVQTGRPKKILDVGCGRGFYIKALSIYSFPKEIYGIDTNEVYLRKATKDISDKRIKILNASAYSLPFSDSYFDFAICSEVLAHLKEDRRALKEMFRVVKSGGILVVTVPSANFPFLWDPLNWILERLFGTHIKSGFFAGLWNQHIRLYSPEQIKKVVESAGVKVEKLESLTFWCLPFNHYLVNLVARYLHNQFILGTPNSPLNKFTTHPSRPSLFNLAFNFVNWIDRLNDIWTPQNTGVSVFVKAVKT